MEGYPINLMEFDARFHSEQACREYLAKIRWSEGVRCPQCDHQQAWITARKLYHCTACEHETSLTAGTVFQDTRKPLMMWFRAMWFVTSQKNGASAMGLKEALGLGSYQTAGELLPGVHRIVSLLKRWRLGTHLGAVGTQHLGYYLDEFAFRFNRRKSHHRGKWFYRLMQQAVALEATPYCKIVAPNKKSSI